MNLGFLKIHVKVAIMSQNVQTEKMGPNDYRKTGLMYNYEMHPKDAKFLNYFFKLPPLAKFISELKARPGTPMVLDLGSGLGLESSSMRERIPNASVVSLDISSVGTISGKEDYDLNQVLADVSTPPFADNLFDGILCKDVLVHVPDKEIFMSNVARIMASNGVFVLSSAKYAYEGLKQFSWYKDELTELGEKSGLKLEKIKVIRMKKEDWYTFDNMERVFMTFRKKKI